VTGGGSGIGAGMCRAFAAEGMKVAVADVDEKAADAVASELRAGGARAIAVPTDVTKLTAVEALAERVESELGGAHVACNNAGVLLGGRMLEHTEGDWRWVLDVNVLGVVFGSQTFGRRFAAQGEGHIVNTASVGGLMAAPSLAPYTTSKYAVVGYTEGLRAELEPQGVGVSALCPGPVATALGGSERLRPPEHGSSSASSRVIDAGIADGLPPDAVGPLVVDGIRRNADYIFTERALREIVVRRFERILAVYGEAPEG